MENNDDLNQEIKGEDLKSLTPLQHRLANGRAGDVKKQIPSSFKLIPTSS
ncbi:MAG: hypothetical protein QM496_18140 [Verrucomicrobiota bacterium]